MLAQHYVEEYTFLVEPNTKPDSNMAPQSESEESDTGTLTQHKQTDTCADPALFQGFIRVYMNLMRPISMSLPARPPSIYDVMGRENTEPETLTTSFYLPKDTTKVIHITSDTTAVEVIVALLQKFKITDNPRKFALYEKTVEEDGEKSLRRVTDCECPLELCLGWSAEGLNNHQFVLQENDTGEIMWDAFSVPELENFMRILAREEEEYCDQLRAKYQLLHIQMRQHCKKIDAKRTEIDYPLKTKRTSKSEATLATSLSPERVASPSSPGSDENVTFAGDQREPVFV